MKTHTGRYKLTWLKDGSRRWRKKYQGKYYHFPLKDGETKESSYSRCLAEWKTKKAEIDNLSVSPWDIARDRIRQRIETLRDGPDTPEARNQYWVLESALGSLNWAEKEGVMSDDELAESLKYVTFDKSGRITYYESEDEIPAGMRRGGGFPLIGANVDPSTDGPPPWERYTPEPAETISGNVPDFLREKKRDADAKKISLPHYDRFRYVLEDFSRFIGEKPLTALTSDLLKAYHQSLEDRIAEGKASANYAKNYANAVTQFVRWLYDRERIDSLPRIMESKSNGLTIKIPKRKIETFNNGEIATLFQKLAPDEDDMRLYLLLMLNCGFTQKDIADLKRSEVDLKAKTITRKRSKTKDHENVPEVTYPLWDETLTLLKAQLQKSGELALLNAKGNPLITEKLSGGKLVRTDNIGLRYRRYRKRLKDDHEITITQKLKALRATGSSTLAKKYAHFTQYYLCQSPHSIADKHYVKPPQAEFSKAIKWLRVALDIPKACSPD